MTSLEKLRKTYSDLVGNTADTVGMIAFANFVKSKMEADEIDIEELNFTISPSEIVVFRQSADQDIDLVKEELIGLIQDEMTADFENGAISGIKKDISELRSATSWKNAILFNLIAWLVSLGLTLLIVKAVEAPAPTELLGAEQN